MRRLALLAAAGVGVLLIGSVTASGRLSGGSHVATDTTTTATPTTVSFHFSVKGRHAVGKGRELTRASGSGTLTLTEPPQQPRTTYSGTSGTGVIKFHQWKVVGHRVILEHNFSMNVATGWYRFNSVAATLQLNGTVAKDDPLGKDLCSPGVAGVFGLGHGIAKGRRDFVGLEMCGFKLGFTNRMSGQRVVVTIKVAPT